MTNRKDPQQKRRTRYTDGGRSYTPGKRTSSLEHQRHQLSKFPGVVFDENYAYRVINDEEARARIETVQERGWEFVVREEVEKLQEDGVDRASELSGSLVSIPAGTDRAGRPMRAYLMRIKKEWKQEDDNFRAQKRRRLEAALQGEQWEKQGDGNYSAKPKHEVIVMKNRLKQ